jgi:hypothetical protein
MAVPLSALSVLSAFSVLFYKRATGLEPATLSLEG